MRSPPHLKRQLKVRKMQFPEHCLKINPIFRKRTGKNALKVIADIGELGVVNSNPVKGLASSAMALYNAVTVGTCLHSAHARSNRGRCHFAHPAAKQSCRPTSLLVHQKTDFGWNMHALQAIDARSHTHYTCNKVYAAGAERHLKVYYIVARAYLFYVQALNQLPCI
uniref:Uncharacterized protein n=1 Tax=Lygus hesperus TaxID=30085 RepID=A0A146M2L8_LYGHE